MLKVSLSGPMVHNIYVFFTSVYMKLEKKQSGYQSYLGFNTKNLFLLHVNNKVQTSLRNHAAWSAPLLFTLWKVK